MNEIQRTKFAQGFEYTKSAKLFSSIETSRSAVLWHRSGCLLRTVEGSWLSLQKSTGTLETQLVVQSSQLLKVCNETPWGVKIQRSRMIG